MTCSVWLARDVDEVLVDSRTESGALVSHRSGEPESQLPRFQHVAPPEDKALVQASSLTGRVG